MLGDNGEKREFRRGDLDARFTGVACVAIGVVSFGESPSSSGKAGMPTTVVGVQIMKWSMLLMFIQRRLPSLIRSYHSLLELFHAWTDYRLHWCIFSSGLIAVKN
jgi:hypothetical protein